MPKEPPDELLKFLDDGERMVRTHLARIRRRILKVTARIGVGYTSRLQIEIEKLRRDERFLLKILSVFDDAATGSIIANGVSDTK